MYQSINFSRSWPKLRSQLGVSIVEVLLVTGVIAAVMGGILMSYTSRQTQLKVDGESDLLMVVRDAVSATTASSNASVLPGLHSFEGANMADVLGSRIIPKNKISGGVIKNYFGGDITFTVLDAPASTGVCPACSPASQKDYLEIKTTDVPKNACYRLVAQNFYRYFMLSTAPTGTGAYNFVPYETSNHDYARLSSANVCSAARNDIKFFVLRTVDMTIASNREQILISPVLLNKEMQKNNGNQLWRSAVMGSL